MDDRLITIEEFADQARSTVDTVRFWRKTGYGPKGFRMGKRVLFAQSDVDQWIAALRQESAGDEK